ncbi:hypothetical protein GCM10028807_02240 [Spirosoma daeguense]
MIYEKKRITLGITLLLGILYILYACRSGQLPIRETNQDPIRENNFEKLELASFAEPDFPYITVPLDAQDLGNNFPKGNVTARGLAFQLGNNAYACFDMDLLRWSVSWTGNFLPMVLPAQASYKDFFKKNNNEIPYVSGSPQTALGMYPGWSSDTPAFQEVRPQSQNSTGLYWGPIPAQIGQWKGVYVHEKTAILSYTIGETDILEMPGSELQKGQIAFTRTFRVGKSTQKLYLNVAEVRNSTRSESKAGIGYIYQGTTHDSVTAVALKGETGTVKVLDNRYMVVEIPASDKIREFTVISWKGAAVDQNKFAQLARKVKKQQLPDYQKGGPTHWQESVVTQGVLAPDTSAFVTDVLTLPLPNPWKRNVRVADISFFSDGRAAVSTYEGDIWIVDGIDQNLGKLKWRRFASGFYESMSIDVYKDQVYVYAKEGIVRLHDLNGDGEADFYENFCNLMQQSTGTREWAADMVADRQGNFYIAKGGHLTGFKGVLPYLPGYGTNKWRASTQHSGSILKVSPDGKNLTVWATGLRMPYIGINRDNGLISASDQQGNYVPATPIYHVKKDDYFGVPVTLHREREPEIARPIAWIPHGVERSGASQTWVNSDKMGPLTHQMVHFSFGRPGIFRVLMNPVSPTVQGGVTLLPATYRSPVIKGEMNAKDGQLYIAGFNNYASNSKGISALLRLRYTGKPSYMTNGFQVGDKGIVLSFDSKIDKASISPENFQVKRWNYRRTEAYGSGHYKLDGTPGEEELLIQSAHLSGDGKQVFLIMGDMRKAEQMEIQFSLKASDGKRIEDGIWITVNDLVKLDLNNFLLKDEDLVIKTNAKLPAKAPVEPVSVARGAELFQQKGCIGCHSPALKTEGMYGPPLGKIVGAKREFTDGTSIIVDETYLKQSILEPGKKVVKGYSSEMPSFAGILTESDIESVIQYIKTL